MKRHQKLCKFKNENQGQRMSSDDLWVNQIEKNRLLSVYYNLYSTVIFIPSNMQKNN